MFKQLSVMEVKAPEDRLHRYECPPNSPLGEVHDALCVMRAHVLEQMQAQLEADKPKEGDADYNTGLFGSRGTLTEVGDPVALREQGQHVQSLDSR